MTPETLEGRMFLIVFALVGIPLNFLVFASIGKHLTYGTYRLTLSKL